MAVPELAINSDSALADAISPGLINPWQQRLRADLAEIWLRRYGRQSNSYFSQQPDCRHYYCDGLGFVPYVPVHTPAGPVNVVFTSPVVAAEQMGALLARFETAVAGQPLYVGLDQSVAAVLEQRGYRSTMMGTEFAVELGEFSLRGRAMKQLRHARNLDRRQPVEVREQLASQLDLAAVMDISSAWRKGKAVRHRELSILTRPPVFGDEWGVRKFFAYVNGKLAGFVFFDPYYDRGHLKGYCANILRANPGDQHTGLLDFIMLKAMEQFRAEGVAEVSLGIAPLHGVRPTPGDLPALRRVQQLLYRYGNRLYAFAPLAYHKTRYRGRETPWYLCSRGLGTATIIWVLLKGTGVLQLPGR